MIAPLEITMFTDPGCPFAFSAEPVRQRLRWLYGDQLRWRPRLIGLTPDPSDAERHTRGTAVLQARYGMPIDISPRARVASSLPACRAVIAARLHAPEAEAGLLRRLRVRGMGGGLLDDPDLIAGAAQDVGLAGDEVHAWAATGAVETELTADMQAARSPSPAARSLDHRLSGPADERRYSAPSYEIGGGGGEMFTIPGFNPVEAYETAIANLAPDLTRRPDPERVDEVLAWANEPLATAEIVAVTQMHAAQAREELRRVAQAIPVGADFYWVGAATR